MTKLIHIFLFFISSSAFSYETGLIKPADRHLGRSYVSLQGYFTDDLPASYDLRDYGWVSPVRSQGGCGSCWWHGTIDSLESSMRMFGDDEFADLSRQQGVNCYYSGCGGGYFAFDKVKVNGVPPSKLEPYTGRNGRCKQDYAEEYKLDTAMSLGSSGRSPAPDEIKAAIYHFGAVAVTVVGGGPMQSYTGGKPKNCSRAGTDHIVTLIGWNADGTWILKNSWGTGWGEKGFGNWPVGCDRVAEEAAVSIYKAVPVANRILLASLPARVAPRKYLAVPYNPMAKYAWYVNDSLVALDNYLPMRTKLGDRIKVVITMPDAITESETVVKFF